MSVEEAAETKVCTKCARCLSLSAYPPAKHMKAGRRNECRECVRVQHKQWRDASPTHKARQKRYTTQHKEAYAVYSLRYRNAHPERVRKAVETWKICHKDEISETSRVYWRHQIDNMGDVYVKGQLRQRGFTSEQITAELIETQRALIQLKRAIKQQEEAR